MKRIRRQLHILRAALRTFVWNRLMYSERKEIVKGTNLHVFFYILISYLCCFHGHYHHTNNRQCCVCSCQLVRPGCCEWVIIQPAIVYLSACRLSAQLVPAGLEQQIGQAWKLSWWRWALPSGTVMPAGTDGDGQDMCGAGRHLGLSVCQPLQIGWSIQWIGRAVPAWGWHMKRTGTVGGVSRVLEEWVWQRADVCVIIILESCWGKGSYTHKQALLVLHASKHVINSFQPMAFIYFNTHIVSVYLNPSVCCS